MIWQRYMFAYVHLYIFAKYLMIVTSENIIYNNGLESQTCMLSVFGVSYSQCLLRFRGNTSNENVMVYKRKFSLCNTFHTPGSPLFLGQPGSILAYNGPISGKYGIER